MQNLLKKAFKAKKNCKISVDICLYKILISFFSNTGHKDNDYISIDNWKLVHECVDESPHNKLKEYISHLLDVFAGEDSLLQLKITLTCVMEREFIFTFP